MLKFEFTPQVIQYIGQVLAQQPFVQVVNIIQDINNQIAAQQVKQPPDESKGTE